MAEWGYFEGTIRKVIEKILEQSQNSLSKDEIIEKVLKIRQVKKKYYYYKFE